MFSENKKATGTTTSGPSLAAQARVSGKYTFSVSRKKGVSRGVVAEFDNLILDYGLRDMLDGDAGRLLNYLHVGTSSLEPAVDQFALGSHIAYAACAPLAPRELVGGSPFVNVQRFQATFPEGEAVGSIAEVGVGPGNPTLPSGPTNSLFSRALVRDSEGAPTVVEVAEDEVLNVTYTLTVSIDVSDKLFTLNLSSGVHTGVLRPCGLVAGVALPELDRATGKLPLADYYTGPGVALGPVTGKPTGSSFGIGISGSSKTIEPSTELTHRDVLYEIALGAANRDDGIGALTTEYLFFSAFQLSFDPPIPKTPESVFRFRLRYSVARA